MNMFRFNLKHLYRLSTSFFNMNYLNNYMSHLEKQQQSPTEEAKEPKIRDLG